MKEKETIRSREIFPASASLAHKGANRGIGDVSRCGKSSFFVVRRAEEEVQESWRRARFDIRDVFYAWKFADEAHGGAAFRAGVIGFWMGLGSAYNSSEQEDYAGVILSGSTTLKNLFIHPSPVSFMLAQCTNDQNFHFLLAPRKLFDNLLFKQFFNGTPP